LPSSCRDRLLPGPDLHSPDTAFWETGAEISRISDILQAVTAFAATFAPHFEQHTRLDRHIHAARVF
jgi:hypothetical protein